MRPTQKVKYRIPSQTMIGNILRLIGIEINTKYEIGYFHEPGFSGKQKKRKMDLVIIEKENGEVLCVPNKPKYFKLINP
jgi:hypothetical protein